MRTITSSDDRPSRMVPRKPFVSPVEKGNSIGSTSPLERTVAETPSPGGTGLFSPETLQVKAVPEKPFDETPNKSPGKPFEKSGSREEAVESRGK